MSKLQLGESQTCSFLAPLVISWIIAMINELFRYISRWIKLHVPSWIRETKGQLRTKEKCYTEPLLSPCWRIRISGLFPFRSSLKLWNLQTSGRTSLMVDLRYQGRYLRVHRTTQTQIKHRHVSTPRVGFELTIPVYERARTFRALNRTATMIVLTFFSFH
jgi:hypothetical protein